ncbi:MAG: hypothetical protein HKO07_02930 [Pseudomonadales bacterium]|nr:hypothetical protein [Pseudomonadales bacterium]
MSNTPTIRKTDARFNNPEQTSRFVTIAGEWFFLTREREMHGPFAVRAAAETALQIFLQESGEPQQSASPQYPVGSYTVSHSDDEKHGNHKSNQSKQNNVVDWHSARANLLG